MKEALSKYPVVIELPVQWGEMDAAQHVNNLVYLKWSESARIVYFEKLKIDTSFGGANAGPILGWQECKYIFPMTYPDTAIIGVRTSEIREDRFILEAGIFSKKHQRIVAVSKHSIIPYNYTDLKKVAIPEEWLMAIKKLEEGKIG